MGSIKNLLLSFIILMSLTGMSYAAPHIEKVGYHTMQLKQRINRQFDNVNVVQTTPQNGIVRISFYVNKNGNLSIIQSNYSDLKLYDIVKEKIESIQLNESSDLAGKEFHYEFKFKLNDDR